VDEELAKTEVRVERKVFHFTLRENPRGRFLRITEDVGGRRDAIVIPSSGLAGIHEALDLMVEADKQAGIRPPPLPEAESPP
jgi:hypothetical protein